MRVIDKILAILILSIACVNVSGQTLSINASADGGMTVNNVLHVLNNKTISFDVSLSVPNDSITKVDSFKYTFDGRTSDITSSVSSGKLTIPSFSVSSGSMSNSQKNFDVALKYFTGDSVATNGVNVWKDDAKSHDVSSSLSVKVWGTPKADLSGSTSQRVKGVANGIKWTVKPSGGYDSGWAYEWEYNGTTRTGATFELPRFENTTTSDQTLTVNLKITNYAPDNRTVWYSDTKTITVVVEKAPSVEPISDINGYRGKSHTVSLKVNNATSGWSFRWTFNGQTKTTSEPNFSFTFPETSGDNSWSGSLNVVVSHTSGFVVNAEQTVAVNSYSPGRTSVVKVDSLLVNGGSSITLKAVTYGGMPSGWSYRWKDNGKVFAINDLATFTFDTDNETNAPVEHLYSVVITNQIGNEVGCQKEETFDALQVWPNCKYPTAVSMTDETRGRPTGMYCIREGNVFSLNISGYHGGYAVNGVEQWSVMWSGKNMGNTSEPPTLVAALSSSSESQTIETVTYNAKMTNYGPYGHEWSSRIVPCDVKVYKRPKTPNGLVRKGNGTSSTLIASMPTLTDSDLDTYSYKLVFGYEDIYGMDHDSSPIQQEEGMARYDKLNPSLFGDLSIRFYVYALWQYPDGAKVTSGKCYMDGSKDETWDGSLFGSETRSVGDTDEGTTGIEDIIGNDGIINVYNITGVKMESINNLPAGIYIKETISNGNKSITKFVVK